MEKMHEVYNFTVDPENVPGDFVAYTVDHLFGDVWCRPDLAVPERRLLTIGVLAALGKTDLLDVQFTSALANGELTEDQVREIVVHLVHYIGWPLATGPECGGRTGHRPAEQPMNSYDFSGKGSNRLSE